MGWAAVDALARRYVKDGLCERLEQARGQALMDLVTANATNRVGAESVPLGLGHGTNDMVIEWPTQGRPVYGALDASRRCWGGVVTDNDHTWLSFNGLPPTLAADGSLAPFAGFQVVRNETVPGLSRASGNLVSPPAQLGGYNQNLAWSASWDAWDGAPQDTATLWQMSLRATDGFTHTVDVTPRRAQLFRPAPGTVANWQNRRVNDNVQIQSGTATVDGFGLITVSNVTVSPAGNRLRIEWVPVASLEISPASISLSSGAVSGRQIAVAANVAWTAATNAPWLWITAGATGMANGLVTFSVATNSGGGARTGTITVVGSGLGRTCTVVQAGNSWEAGYENIGGGWRRLAWFGDYVPMGGDGWIWHNRHGFFYVAAGGTLESLWLFANDQGWLWTSSTIYPFLYRASPAAWLWYNGSTNPRWFMNLTSNRWENWP